MFNFIIVFVQLCTDICF